jgi:hypothetical protein
MEVICSAETSLDFSNALHGVLTQADTILNEMKITGNVVSHISEELDL